MRLEGKVAIITGGAQGMGSEEAILFAKEGAKVVIADVNDDQGELLATSINTSSGASLYVRTDVTNERDWDHCIQATLSKFGKLDILINNAGISSYSVEDPDNTEGWHRIMDVNATGVFLGTKYAVPEMKKAGKGSIVNISSIMGFIGDGTGHPAYHASKGAVRIFTKACAVRHGPDGIRVNSVHPGYMPRMKTTIHSNPNLREEQAKLTPLRRTGEPIEVAYGVLFLASDESSFITGTELVIDGGFIAR